MTYVFNFVYLNDDEQLESVLFITKNKREGFIKLYEYCLDWLDLEDDERWDKLPESLQEGLQSNNINEQATSFADHLSTMTINEIEDFVKENGNSFYKVEWYFKMELID